ncbi:Uncharacterized protein Fot_13534 [Forsythia ovata]|uniref:Uncharacterized protein n=1 Tax=Forsythia ovata TaxID=205694 RepID=A0ABD1W3T7_9LAMI
MGLSVGIPLFIGLLFFPFFYYLKVGLKIDVPTWIPFIVSFIFFGTALLGVSYGIVSSSWDPMREGSLLGWNEAKKNWPVFWQSIWGGSKKKLQAFHGREREASPKCHEDCKTHCAPIVRSQRTLPFPVGLELARVMMCRFPSFKGLGPLCGILVFHGSLLIGDYLTSCHVCKRMARNS